MKALEIASTTKNLQDFAEIIASAVDKSLDNYLYKWRFERINNMKIF